MTETFVGTSGWLYDWNAGGSLDWYAARSGLNAIELNASFYRFPFPSQVKGWRRRGSRLRWAVKVHRSITHYRRMGSGALDIWRKFKSLFEPLDDLVDFYLFQLPPRFTRTERNIEKLSRFSEAVELGSRMAIEFRHQSWFCEETIELCREIGATIVSIDSPIGTWIASSNDIVYLRMHGRSAWYAHDYSEEELRGLLREVLELQPARIYVFFNNDHWMLENARLMKKLLSTTAQAI